MKNNRHGKAAIFTDDEIIKIRKAMGALTQHRAIWEVALLTGERIGAIVRGAYRCRCTLLLVCEWVLSSPTEALFQHTDKITTTAS